MNARQNPESLDWKGWVAITTNSYGVPPVQGWTGYMGRLSESQPEWEASVGMVQIEDAMEFASVVQPSGPPNGPQVGMQRTVHGSLIEYLTDPITVSVRPVVMIRLDRLPVAALRPFDAARRAALAQRKEIMTDAPRIHMPDKPRLVT